MDINTVIADITQSLQDAYAVAGTQSPMDQLTAANAALTTANAQVATLTTTDAALQAKIDKIKADLAQAVTDAG